MTAPVKIASGKNFIVYRVGEEESILIQNVRASHPHLGTQQENDTDTGKSFSWNGTAMLNKAEHKEAKEAFMGIVRRLMEKNKVKIPREYLAIKDGDDKEDEVLHGHWVVAFSDKGKRRPPVRDKDKQIVTETAEIDEMFYGGCWMNIWLRPWYFNGVSKKNNKTYPKRICCGFLGVQFVRDDKPFGKARVDDTDVWGSADSDGDDDGMDSDDGL